MTSLSFLSDKCRRNVDLSRLPDIVVNSAGTQTIAIWPSVANCVGTISGCHSNGKFICKRMQYTILSIYFTSCLNKHVTIVTMYQRGRKKRKNWIDSSVQGTEWLTLKSLPIMDPLEEEFGSSTYLELAACRGTNLDNGTKTKLKKIWRAI